MGESAKVSAEFYEGQRLKAKADWLRLAADIVRGSETKEQAEQRLEKAAKEAEEARDEYIKNSH